MFPFRVCSLDHISSTPSLSKSLSVTCNLNVYHKRSCTNWLFKIGGVVPINKNWVGNDVTKLTIESENRDMISTILIFQL